MSTVGAYTAEEFVERFPLEFSDKVRGSLVVNGTGESIGLIVAHMLKDGEVCAGSLFWEKHNNEPPLWGLLSKAGEPLTLEPSILCVNCSENLHGYIKEGNWVPA